MQNKKVGISIGRFQRLYGDVEALDVAARVGADAVDMTTHGPRFDYRDPDSIFSRGDDAIVEHFTRVRERADQLGITISQTHGRIKIFYNDPADDAAVLENARLDLLAAKALGAPVSVMHGVTTSRTGPHAPPQYVRDLNHKLFSQILPLARKYGVKVATETFGDAAKFACVDFFGNTDEFERAYKRLCAEEDFDKWFAVCVDTGHSNKAMRFGNPSAADVIRRMGSAVEVLHLNDNDTLTDQHRPPLAGNLDWEDILTALDEIGYDGVYNMELNLGNFGDELAEDTAAFAIKVMRNLLKNHYEK